MAAPDPASGTPAPNGRAPRESWASWLGLNRATVAVLVSIGGLGLSYELWSNFLPLHVKQLVSFKPEVAQAGGDAILKETVTYVALYSFLVNLAEGFAYILGGAFAQRLGARLALAISALPMAAGFVLLLTTQEPWAVILGALLMTNWEPLSLPATFEVVGSEVPRDRRTIAFAAQSIQKRLPKVLGPLIGGLIFALGYWVNLTLAFGVLALAVLVQMSLLHRMRPKAPAAEVPLAQVLREIPPDLRLLLSAEVLLRWGDWFVRDFAVLYVVGVLGCNSKEYGSLAALTAVTALLTYIPMAKLIDRASSPKPFIGLTFFLFALFPFALVLLPKTGLPVLAALAAAFAINGLREIGEPARKALIASGFPPEVRARAIGLYWGLRSFCFCPAPLLAGWLWRNDAIGPDGTFLIGGALGLAGTLWFWLRVRCLPRPAAG